MTERVLTVRSLTSPGRRPGLFELRVLERTTRARIAGLDARVDELLALAGPPTDDEIAQVDVLCAAICESAELLEDLRAEASEHVARHRRRRERPRRWA